MSEDSWDGFECEALELTRAGRTGGVCAVGQLLKGLDEKGVKAIEGALGRPDLTSSAILKAIRKRVELPNISIYALRRHRRQDCACTRDG